MFLPLSRIALILVSSAFLISNAIGQETRSVTHSMGETMVPSAPQRVVVLDLAQLDAVLALGITPVGTATSDGGILPYLEELAPSIERVGDKSDFSMEQVIALNPDLIISSKERHEELYDLLSAIAPTVYTETLWGWEDNIRLIGESVGKADEAEAFLAAYEKRTAAIGAAVDADSKTALILHTRPDLLRLYGPGSFAGDILVDIGFQVADRSWRSDGRVDLSLEQIDQVESDILFLSVRGDQKDTPLGNAAQLWSNLDVVKNGGVYEVTDGTWLLSQGPLGALKILDEIEAALLP